MSNKMILKFKLKLIFQKICQTKKNYQLYKRLICKKFQYQKKNLMMKINYTTIMLELNKTMAKSMINIKLKKFFRIINKWKYVTKILKKILKILWKLKNSKKE